MNCYTKIYKFQLFFLFLNEMCNTLKDLGILFFRFLIKLQIVIFYINKFISMKKPLTLLWLLGVSSVLLAWCSCNQSTEKSESTNVLSQENVTMETQRTNYGELKETPIEKEDLVLTEEWDKVFPKSDKVNHRKVTFVNRFGITLAADLYEPKDAEGKLPAIAVAGPFGAVKEQSNGLYAQEMAERWFIALAFDPSFMWESGGKPRNLASPDINTEDFQAAVDFLMMQDNVDADKIWIIWICGWWGIALNTASIDTRVKATVVSTMYNMSRVAHYWYFDANSEDDIYAAKESTNAQRLEDLKNWKYALAGWVVDPLPEDAADFVKDYYAYYKTERWYHPRSLNSNSWWNVTSSLSLMNTPQLAYTNEIRNAVLIIHGEKAHSRYFWEDAYNDMVKDSKYTENKELLIVSGATHTDLYDQKDIIPFDKIESFMRENME